jgi:hypothetical protein
VLTIRYFIIVAPAMCKWATTDAHLHRETGYRLIAIFLAIVLCAALHVPIACTGFAFAFQ